MNGNTVYLNINDGFREYSIPFIGLKYLDLFTSRFKDSKDLLIALNNILNASINVNNKVSLYITGTMYKYNGNDSLTMIKYSDDDFKYDSVRDLLYEYLCDDVKRILSCDARFVIAPWAKNESDVRKISSSSIKMGVNSFLNVNNNYKDKYKALRDMYFLLKREWKKPDTYKKTGEYVPRYSLDKLESRKDDDIQYLIELASRDEESRERAMEELSLMDMEDIISSLGRSYHGVLDGASDERMVNPNDIDALEECTDMSIYELREMIDSNIYDMFRMSRRR